ncbi:MAG: alpha/beta hydrolase [Cyanobacteria bacterium J06621_11]
MTIERLSIEGKRDIFVSKKEYGTDRMTTGTVEATTKALRPIYFVSGLGADERIFQWLRYDGFRPVHIQWISPNKGEPIEDYAKRLTSQIEDNNPVVVGLSFGGMIAVEIAKHLDTEKVILLSSIKQVSEVPFYFKIFRLFPLHRIVPFKSLLWAFYWLAYWLFAPEGSDQKKLLKTVLIETDPHFLKWALHKVVVWQNKEIPETLVHVHGKRDRIFPWRFVNPDYSLENSGHLMVMNRAEAVSDLLEILILQANEACETEVPESESEASVSLTSESLASEAGDAVAI